MSDDRSPSAPQAAATIAPQRGWLGILVLVSVASLAARIALSFRYFGFQTGDDVEIAEQAFRRALALQHTPWDIRSTFIPDLLVAPLVAAANTMGLTQPLALVHVAKVPFLIAGTLNVILVYALARRWYGEPAGVIACALFASHWIPLVYGSSLYVRTLSTTLILVAALLISCGGRRWAALAGVAAALTLTARYSEALFAIAFLALILTDRLPRKAARAAWFVGAYIATMAVVICWYDALTWGKPFASMLAFARLTFIRADASSVSSVQPPWWYLANVAHWFPLALVPLCYASFRSGGERRYLWLVGFPVLVLSAIFHKELRYLQPVIPFVCIAAGGGAMIWWSKRERRRWVVALLLIALPWSMARVGQASKRSTNAVAAALMIERLHPSVVGLSQSWAYGNRLIFGNEPEIVDIGLPPNAALVLNSGASMTALAVYEQQVDDALRRAAHESGLVHETVVAGNGGRAVLVFTHRQPRSSHR